MIPELLSVAPEDLTDGTYLFVGSIRYKSPWKPGSPDIGTVEIRHRATGRPMIFGFGDFRKLSDTKGQWFRIEIPEELLAAEQLRINREFLRERLKEAWWVKTPPTWPNFKVTPEMMQDLLKLKEDPELEHQLSDLYFSDPGSFQ